MQTVLVVDDSILSRTEIRNILSGTYAVIEAADGREGIEVLKSKAAEIDAMVLDLIMPVMDGFEVLKAIRETKEVRNIPIVVVTSENRGREEKKALELGAWDYVKKPVDGDILKFRIRNVIERSQIAALRKIKFLSECDSLTGLFNKDKFFQVTADMIAGNSKEKYVFIKCDIKKFQIINTFCGEKQGATILRHYARLVKNFADEHGGTYGRINSDVFGICAPYKSQEDLTCFFNKVKYEFENYQLDYEVSPNFGYYEIEDNSEDIPSIFFKANLAAKRSKDSYTFFYREFCPSMQEETLKEQEITKIMHTALEEEQFKVYLQPKIDLNTNMIAGAEALVRWVKPNGEIVPPGDFIPLFEKNGFVTEMDYSVWESSCKLLRKWLDEGKDVLPISVNISRVNLYTSNFIEKIEELTEKYQLPVELFNLEFTESAHVDDYKDLCDAIVKLHEKGYIIYMDDFGSGYSSLNFLKDIPVDVLKIDLHLLAETTSPGKGENIIAAMVRMTKWLGIPVVVEGVETKKQLDFLHSIGCEYCQGYYFAKPMPAEEYPDFLQEFNRNEKAVNREASRLPEFAATLFDKQVDFVFNNVPQAIGLYEFDGKNIELLKANNQFLSLAAIPSECFEKNNLLENVHADYKKGLLQTFKKAVKTKEIVRYEYKLKINDYWHTFEIKLKCINNAKGKYLLFAAPHYRLKSPDVTGESTLVK